jgi:transposase
LAGIAERGFRNQRKCDSLSLVARCWGAAMAWRRGQSYSEDLRARVLAAVDGGMAARAAARLFRVSVSYIYKALIRRRRTGEVSASSRRGHRPRKLTVAQEAALGSHIAAHPDLTLAALQIWLDAQHAVRHSNGAMWSAVARLGLSFKKRHSTPPSKTVPTSRPGAASGARRSLLLMPTSSSSSTRPAPAPR